MIGYRRTHLGVFLLALQHYRAWLPIRPTLLNLFRYHIEDAALTLFSLLFARGSEVLLAGLLTDIDRQCFSYPRKGALEGGTRLNCEPHRRSF